MKTRELALGLIGVYAGFRFALRMKRRISFAGKTVVITGGSRGLGLVIARRLARERAKLVLIARDRDELQRAELQLLELGAHTMIVPADVGDREQVEAAIEQAIARFGTIDVLINDAGTIQVGPVEHMTLGDFERSMNVHFWGPLHAISAVLPEMRAKNFGRIVNIASIGGQVAVPHMAPYNASKFALVGLSDTLRAELAKDNIFVTTVCPILMRIGSARNAEFKGRAEEEYAWFRGLAAAPGISINAERAAARILRACKYGRANTFVSPLGRVLAVLTRIAPEVSAESMSLLNRVLPSYDEEGDVLARRGADLVPSAFDDELALKNNEL
jgi:NAD(P)-dependent dehydrogenase (short-subunit alcohol dehydrogenase family)